MRIGFFTTLYVPDTGGAEIHLDRLARSLMGRGHAVAVVAPQRRGTRPRLPYPVVRTLRPFSRTALLHHSLPPLLWARRRHRLEILHCQGEYEPACVARTLKRLTGTPYVVRAIGGGFDVAQERGGLRRRVERALGAADGVIAQGESLRGQLLEYGAPPDRLVTIHNGVDPAEILVEGPRPRPEPYILFGGGLRPIKAWDVLLRAFAAIARDVAPVRLLLCGAGPQRAAFERLRADLGLTARVVEYLGVLDRRDMAIYLRHALLYVCPFHRAPFPNANLEAMTAGVPLVATAVDGNLEQIRDGAEGLLVPPGDVGALAEAMRRVYRDEPLRKRLAAGAAARARGFTWDAMVGAYERFYGDVLARGRGV